MAFGFDPNDPRKYGLMQAALALMGSRGGNLAQNIGQAGMMGLGGYQEATRAKDRRAEEAQLREQRQMMLDQQKRQMQEQEQIRSLAGQAFGPNPNAQNFQGQPMLADDGTMPPQAPGGGGMPEFAKGLMGINPMLGAQFMPKPRGPVALAEGGRLIDPETGREIASNPKPQKPLFQPGQTRELKSGRMVYTQEYDGQQWKTISKSSMDAPDKPDKPDKPPQGYRWAGDRLEAIPGGPADAKVGAQAEALAKRERGAMERADFVLGQVGKAIEGTGPTTAGPIGAIARKIPGSGAYNLNKTVDAIKANIGFAELQAMREASPTGGALGQVAVQELNMLQSVLGSLDTAQSPDQLLQALYAVEKHYRNWKQTVQRSKETKQDGGGKVINWEDLP